MAKWFYKQNILVQIILMLIPGVNWIVELCVRWSAWTSRPTLPTLICAILTIRYHFRLGGSGMVAAFQTPVVCESIKTNVVFLSEARRFFNGDRI